MNDFKDKKVLIIGLARSGIASLDKLSELGAKVYVQDSKDESKIDSELVDKINRKCVGKFLGILPNLNLSFDYVVVSPGVDPELEFISNEVKKGANLIGELELAYRLSNASFVAITGTNGKTTTTSMVGEIFKNAGKNSHVVGNIGIPVLNYVNDNEKDEYLITEVSSFQLQTTSEFRPHVAAILNVTPDHLNRHHTLENYALTKAHISAKQDENDYLILNYEDELCYSLKNHSKAKIVPFSSKRELDYGAFYDGEFLILKTENKAIKVLKASELTVIGMHNIENALAAILLAYYSGISLDIISESLRKFKAVEHRMEFVRELDGVKYYNDSKGTNVDATIIAIKAVDKNIILIAGGDAKSQNFDELAKYFEGHVKHMTLFGRDRNFISESADKVGFKDYSIHKTLKDCVIYAKSIANPGDTILLSPACASWDMYPNFEVRGREFKDIVNSL